MHDDDSSDLYVSLALARLAWPQLVTLFSFLSAVLMRFPLWFDGLAVLVVIASVSRISADVATNSRRPFRLTMIDCLLIASGWAAGLLSMWWWAVERAQHLEAGALLTPASQDFLIFTTELAWCPAVTQWISSAVVLVVTLVWAFSGRYRD
ncbi:hypothetical protein [Ralstonia syzygii]|uniref:Transmembrane protein n=1 Tax=Ralstonia syzygii R24 TaxID=907261 RepID=G2ZY74_9RALS|nr:hypothetical protein [Ralstonia syzygii]CCA85268.1 membrane hypothetical protein [Ralstonia syzygii R24]